MLSLEYVLAFVSVSTNKVKKFEWLRLVPQFRVDEYRGWPASAGIELTWRVGLGIGFGLGIYDLWFGWPRSDKGLHVSECGHEVKDCD